MAGFAQTRKQSPRWRFAVDLPSVLICPVPWLALGWDSDAGGAEGAARAGVGEQGRDGLGVSKIAVVFAVKTHQQSA